MIQYSLLHTRLWNLRDVFSITFEFPRSDTSARTPDRRVAAAERNKMKLRRIEEVISLRDSRAETPVP